MLHQDISNDFVKLIIHLKYVKYWFEFMIFLCSQIENSILAEYELEYLLLEGHCFEQNTGQPPRGLQFTLGTKAEPVQVDTIVMANLVSYLQWDDVAFRGSESYCQTDVDVVFLVIISYKEAGVRS